MFYNQNTVVVKIQKFCFCHISFSLVSHCRAALKNPMSQTVGQWWSERAATGVAQQHTAMLGLFIYFVCDYTARFRNLIFSTSDLCSAKTFGLPLKQKRASSLIMYVQNTRVIMKHAVSVPLSCKWLQSFELK